MKVAEKKKAKAKAKSPAKKEKENVTKVANDRKDTKKTKG